LLVRVEVQKRVIRALLDEVNALKDANAKLKACGEETETEVFLRDYTRPYYLVPKVLVPKSMLNFSIVKQSFLLLSG
jgi:hypothetical protein